MATIIAANRTLFIGDNLPVLRGINSESVDLIATDPPFNKGVKATVALFTHVGHIAMNYSQDVR